jgi:RimJ/RimL family protein N-acetyltransferase
MTSPLREFAMATTELQGFARGEMLILRPVQEGDLAELARIMAQAPGGRKPLPWTEQRLKKLFEDEKNPGLWSDAGKYFAAVLHDGTVVGYIREHYEAWIQSHDLSLHVDERRADRDALGREVVALYMDYLTRWHNPGMVISEPLEIDTQKRAWLEAAGFFLQFTQERSELYQGSVVGRCAYAWHSAERGAGIDYSLGEPEYPPHGASRGATQEAR